MATQKLSPAHEAAFYEQGGLIIRETFGDYESVALARKEVAALRALITPAITDKEIDKFLDGINEKACDIDYTIYGLPLNGKDVAVRESFRQIVRNWLAAPDQSPIPTKDK